MNTRRILVEVWRYLSNLFLSVAIYICWPLSWLVLVCSIKANIASVPVLNQSENPCVSVLQCEVNFTVIIEH
jgi:hypothetical protein